MLIQFDLCRTFTSDSEWRENVIFDVGVVEAVVEDEIGNPDDVPDFIVNSIGSSWSIF